MCTNLLLSVPRSPLDPDNRVYASARALELAGVLDSSIYLVPRHQSFPLAPPSGGTFQWRNKYGFVGIASPTKFQAFPCFMDGLNEAGLSAAALWLPGTVYATSGPNPTVTFSDVVAWMLGNYQHVAELEADLTQHPRISIVGPTSSAGDFLPLHFIATDATGASVVVEFVNGAMSVYGPSSGANGVPPGATTDGVLTNAPTYDWHRTNLQSYQTLSIVGPETSRTDTTGPAVGSGMLGMPGDPMSASRFVRAATLRQGYDRSFHLLPADGRGWLPAPGGSAAKGFADATQTVINVAMQLVQMVMETPYATTLAKTTPVEGESHAKLGDWTMWCVVRNHTDPTYFFTSAFNGIMRGITLAPALFDPSTSPTFPNFMSIAVLPSPGLSWYEPVEFS